MVRIRYIWTLTWCVGSCYKILSCNAKRETLSERKELVCDELLSRSSVQSFST
jgi:hypothetical protein